VVLTFFREPPGPVLEQGKNKKIIARPCVQKTRIGGMKIGTLNSLDGSNFVESHIQVNWWFSVIT
jgi:hypothetical protein